MTYMTVIRGEGASKGGMSTMAIAYGSLTHNATIDAAVGPNKLFTDVYMH